MASGAAQTVAIAGAAIAAARPITRALAIGLVRLFGAKSVEEASRALDGRRRPP